MTEALKMNETKPKSEDEWLGGWMHQLFYVQLRGIVASVPMIKVEKVFMMATLTLARCFSELYAGDELAVRRMRKMCRDVFKETLDKMPVIPLEKGPTKTDTASIEGAGS